MRIGAHKIIDSINEQHGRAVHGQNVWWMVGLSAASEIAARLHGPLYGFHGVLQGFGLAAVRAIRPLDQLTAPADRPLEVALRLGKRQDLDGLGVRHV